MKIKNILTKKIKTMVKYKIPIKNNKIKNKYNHNHNKI